VHHNMSRYAKHEQAQTYNDSAGVPNTALPDISMSVFTSKVA